MSIKTKLLEDYVNFVDTSLLEHIDTRKNNNLNYKIIAVLFVIISWFLVFLPLNDYFFVEQIFKKGNFDVNLILRQNKLDLLSRFMET